ncbi:MAG: GreA/GreB family elongation factor [Burkholderiaceae bacterium]
MKRTERDDIVLGSADAGALRNLLDTLEHLDRFDDAAEALDSLLELARIVAQPELPADRAALGGETDYRLGAEEALRTVSLVLPEQADAGQGRVSVLSPVGRALLGRRCGTSAELRLPDGRTPRLEIVEVRRSTDDADHFSAKAFSMT